MASGYLAIVPDLVPVTPAQVRALHADARVRRRVRAILARAAVCPHRLERAVAIAAAAADAASLFCDSGPLVDRIAAAMGRAPTGFERGLIVGLALAIASEGA